MRVTDYAMPGGQYGDGAYADRVSPLLRYPALKLRS